MISQRSAMLVLGVVYVLALVASVVQRSPYIGVLTEGEHQFLTAEQINFVEYWERDGLWADRFLTLENPRSIELTTLAARGVYASFIPGDTLQIYLLHRLLPGVALATFISAYGIGLQALVALFCGLLVFRMIKPEDRAGPALFFVVAAMFTYLFHPVPYYEHPMVQFGYQIALVPFVIATYLEYEIRTGSNRRLVWLQCAVIGWLAAVDWMFIPFGIALTFFRLLSPLDRRHGESAFFSFAKTMFQIWLLPTLICLAFVANLYFNGFLDELLSRAMLRTGVSTDVPLSFLVVYERVFVETLGRNTQFWVHAGALAGVVQLVGDRRDPIAVVCSLCFLTCYLYVVLLPNDVYIHNFESLKFFVPLSIASFGIVPYRLIWSLSGKVKLGALGLMVFLWSFYLIHYRTNWPDWFRPLPPATQQLAEWLRAHAKFDEVYLSDSVEIGDHPPVPVAISGKRVWSFATLAKMRDFHRTVPAEAKFRFVSKIDHRACFDGQPPTVLADGT